MSPATFRYQNLSDGPSSVVREDHIVFGFIVSNRTETFYFANNNASPTASPAWTTSSPRKPKSSKLSSPLRKG